LGFTIMNKEKKEEIKKEEKVEELPEIKDIEELKKALADETARADANMAGWQRAQADFQNYKRFAEQDKVETVKYANVNLLTNLLPTLDDFERALAAIPSGEDHDQWIEGFKLIDRKFRGTLEKLGVTPITSLGEEFDCRTMEAMSCARGKKDIVVQELEKGYKLQDKVIRPAKVIVGTGEEENQEKADKEE
jgi:molecular chaperone GrpE